MDFAFLELKSKKLNLWKNLTTTNKKIMVKKEK